MDDAISRMLAKYRLETLNDHLRALREILQEIALLGLADIAAARREVVPFVPRPDALEGWSPHFFLDLARRIECA